MSVITRHNNYVVCVCVCAGETASNLGTAMDELMRHQPTLKTDAMTAIIKVLLLCNSISFMRVVFQQQVPLLVR